MFALDLGELAYGNGDVVLSKDVALVAPEGEAADLPTSCDPGGCFKYQVKRTINSHFYKELNFLIISLYACVYNNQKVR